MTTRQILLILLLAFAVTTKTTACSGFKLTFNGKTFVGLNEDFFDPYTVLSTKKPTLNTLGILYFGYKDSPKESAINEKGLIMDGFYTPIRKIKKTTGIKLTDKTFEALKEEILLKCSTIEEVIKLVKKYDLSIMSSGQLFLVDKSGNSLIIEADTLIQSNNNYEVVTNFHKSTISQSSPVTCNRYITADSILSKEKELSVTNCKNILNSIHQSKGMYTQYSQIFDLSSGKIYLYLFHNFDEEISFNISDIINQELNSVPMSNYFKNKTNYNNYLNSQVTTSRISKEINNIISLDKMSSLIDTLVTLPYNLPEIYADNLIGIGIDNAKHNDMKKAEQILSFLVKLNLLTLGASQIEYLSAYIDNYKKNYSTAKQHIDLALNRQPKNKDYLLLKKAIGKNIK